MDFQSLVELAPWTTIAQICNLLLQIFLFKKFLFKPIKEIIAKRQAEVDGVYDEAEKARQAARALFGGGANAQDMPTTELTGDDLGSGEINVLNLLVRCGLCASKGEARRLVQQGGVTVGDKKVDSIDASFGCQEFTGDGLIIRKGKKVFHRAVLI